MGVRTVFLFATACFTIREFERSKSIAVAYLNKISVFQCNDILKAPLSNLRYLCKALAKSNYLRLKPTSRSRIILTIIN